MPYILEKDRKDLKIAIRKLHRLLRSNEKHLPVGDVNYCISKLLWLLFDDKPSYARINDILGVLNGINLEFYRRKAQIYEDKKIQENGDI